MKPSKSLAVVCLLCLMMGVLHPRTALSLTLKQEEELSREFMRVVKNNYKLVDDPMLLGYIEKVGKKLLSAMPPQPFTFQFYVVQEDVYNAFAGPAGHIFINSGLFEAMESEEELAGILAHEICHVLCRHISDRIERTKKIGIATLAGIVAGAFLGSGGASTAAGAITAGSMALGNSLSLKFSRDDEIQADQLALKYLDQAGYSARGLITILNKIRQKQWFGSQQIPTYLSTHPAVEERIAYVGSWMEARAAEKTEPPPREADGFDKVHTRFVALNGEENAVLNRFRARLHRNPEDPMADYGDGLILARTGDRQGAADHLKIALEKKAFDPTILKDLGIIYFQDRKHPEALAALEGSASILAGDPEAIFFTGRTLMELGRIDEAASRFEAIQNLPNYPQALFYLAETHSRQGRPGEAHYYLGLFYQKKGEVKNAAFHLKQALRTLTDPEKTATIVEMLKALEKKAA